MKKAEKRKERRAFAPGLIFLIVLFTVGAVASGLGLGTMVMFGASPLGMLIPLVSALMAIVFLVVLVRLMR